MSLQRIGLGISHNDSLPLKHNVDEPKMLLYFIIALFIALVKVVQHLNRKGVVHRILKKADNILLGKETDEARKRVCWNMKPLINGFRF